MLPAASIVHENVRQRWSPPLFGVRSTCNVGTARFPAGDVPNHHAFDPTVHCVSYTCVTEWKGRPASPPSSCQNPDVGFEYPGIVRLDTSRTAIPVPYVNPRYDHCSTPPKGVVICVISAELLY